MMDPIYDGQLPWNTPGWLEAVSEWIDNQLARAGRRVAGPLELIHKRPWSAFVRVVTDQGAVFFKAPAPPFFEVPLTEYLAHRRPDCTIPLLAVDPIRGWMLSADAGVTLRSRGQTVAQIGHWVRLLPGYAEFQMAMADHVSDLLTLGIYDRRLGVFPNLYAQLLEDTDDLLVGQESGLTPDEHRRLLDLRPRVTDLCLRLAGFGLPETLAHEELHENNVLVDGDRYIYTDWSDSSIAHPFFTMLVTLRAAAHWLKLPEDGPDIARLRDAYLEPWTKFSARTEIVAAFDIAYRLGMINRALSWHSALSSLAAEDKREYTDSVPGWLQDFLAAEEEPGS